MGLELMMAAFVQGESGPPPPPPPVINPVTTGAATRLAAFTGESTPTSLASDDTTLYMGGQGGDALYTVNDSTYAITSVGRFVTGSGAGSNPGSMTFHGGTLYMADASWDAVFTVNTATGRATQVSPRNVFGFGINSRFPNGLASLGGTLYAATNTGLITLDTTTWRGTKVGTATQFGVGLSEPGGMAAHGDKLYVVGSSGPIYEVNATTGVATRVGSANLPFGSGGLVSHKGTLLLVSWGQRAFYSIA